jgi:hypothetical protein
LNSQSELRLYHTKSMLTDTTNHVLRSLMISKNYSKNHYGVFCKLENRIHKNTKFPVRFRLGSLDYVNKLEGKQ